MRDLICGSGDGVGDDDTYGNNSNIKLTSRAEHFKENIHHKNNKVFGWARYSHGRIF